MDRARATALAGSLFTLAVLGTALAVPATGHPESAAPALRPDVLAAWHDPPIVPPHTQWHGYLHLSADSNVSAAAYQVCRVGLACFAPPAAAQDMGNGTWGFDTADYTVNGRPVDYEPGWRLGVKWWLTERRGDGNVTVEYPAGPDPSSPACAGEAALACAEAHYLAFDVEQAAKGAPLGMATGVLAVLSAAAAALRARRRGP